VRNIGRKEVGRFARFLNGNDGSGFSAGGKGVRRLGSVENREMLHCCWAKGERCESIGYVIWSARGHKVESLDITVVSFLVVKGEHKVQLPERRLFINLHSAPQKGRVVFCEK